MLLHAEVTGDGSRSVLLLHGLMGSGSSWWRVAERLGRQGDRVITLDLPGHGRSPRAPSATLALFAEAVVDTMAELGHAHPDVVFGHSLGGLVLAMSAPSLMPRLAVFVDSPFRSRGGWDRADVAAEYRAAVADRTEDRLAELRPHYTRRDRQVEALAAALFDPETAASLAAGPGGEWLPSPGSVVLRADPSDSLDDESAARLAGAGVTVRSVPGAAHSIWCSHWEEFVAALPEVFRPTG